MGGVLETLAGQIFLKATQTSLTIESSGQILAEGYNKPDAKPVMAGLPLGYTPMSGGTVTLIANNANLPNTGDVIMEAGSLVDVSGSAPTTSYVSGVMGRPTSIATAGDPGSISIAFAGTSSLEGTLMARLQ